MTMTEEKLNELAGSEHDKQTQNYDREKPANKWSDEDMIKAFIASSWNEISCDPLTAEQWLEQYKVVKNG